MEQLVQADIFFFITSVAVIVSSIVLIVAFVYIIQILRDVRYITKCVRKESDAILDDVHQARKFMEKEVKRAFDLKDVVTGVLGMFSAKKRSRKTTKKK